MSYDFLCINVMIFFVFPLQIINRLLVLLPFPVQNFLYFLLRLCFYLLQFFLCLFFQVPVKLIPFFLYPIASSNSRAGLLKNSPSPTRPWARR